MRTMNQLVLNYKGQENIFAYYPGSPQWWTTGFNPDCQGVKEWELSAVGRMDFSNNPALFYDFYNQNKGKEGLDFDKNSNTVTIKW